eukprot:11308625-Karenia_brevis.AAC.1
MTAEVSSNSEVSSEDTSSDESVANPEWMSRRVRELEMIRASEGGVYRHLESGSRKISTMLVGSASIKALKVEHSPHQYTPTRYLVAEKPASEGVKMGE